MSGVNKAILIGRTGKDPEVKTLPNGNMLANFSLATSESFKDKTTGEKKETTTWHNIVIWGKLAEVAAKYVHKGDLLYLEGKINNRSYDKDGVTRYVSEIMVSAMTMLGSKNRSSEGGAPPSAATTNFAKTTSADEAFDSLPKTTEGVDDLPF